MLSCLRIRDLAIIDEWSSSLLGGLRITAKTRAAARELLVQARHVA